MQMNLDLMFLATELTGDAKYQQIAISQAEKSSKTHIRPDFTTNHVVNFDPTTGDATAAYTHQGGSHRAGKGGGGNSSGAWMCEADA